MLLPSGDLGWRNRVAVENLAGSRCWGDRGFHFWGRGILNGRKMREVGREGVGCRGPSRGGRGR